MSDVVMKGLTLSPQPVLVHINIFSVGQGGKGKQVSFNNEYVYLSPNPGDIRVMAISTFDDIK